MASLNINSLLAHIDQLRVFIDNSNIDILAINETKLDFSIDDDQIHLAGYDIVRKDRIQNGRSGGGVCIYLRSNLNFRIRENLLNDNLECLVIEIFKIDVENSEFHLLGDINCNMLSGSPDSKGGFPVLARSSSQLAASDA